ncbi:hypothetical protein ABEF92_008640 [Exophiala dermatitidis]|uniref:Uncharacterized protein n=1 Tax=Exophiala dermatitidis (strain ATCC 34100 / CBS 525.76 / NIH/UT8656) TaxID=858893 RepID=H6C2V3_EXODN|nr:uncharacterized protein HMPREF1120_06829 [Exophiala dermatitidis NIH/UT8656]EHY58827.1 hypothetical protein HMPREF1120_06829 [Exophiala dermatitidis NIH/UT8656]KAJ4508602.1 hypothetical protein HRR75_006423 [Exophiala dermatitidis]KAJ4545420.1 hypothetical protein HRR78_006142 [Exophiala dermatitidis]
MPPKKVAKRKAPAKKGDRPPKRRATGRHPLDHDPIEIIQPSCAINNSMRIPWEPPEWLTVPPPPVPGSKGNEDDDADVEFILPSAPELPAQRQRRKIVDHPNSGHESNTGFAEAIANHTLLNTTSDDLNLPEVLTLEDLELGRSLLFFDIEDFLGKVVNDVDEEEKDGFERQDDFIRL